MTKNPPHACRRRPPSFHGGARHERGLTLVECVVSLVIVALGVTLVLRADVGTTESALHATNNQLAALLANEIMALEAMGEMPEGDLGILRIGPMTIAPGDDRFVDPDTSYFPYLGFEYEVTKRIETIRSDTDLSVGSEYRDEEQFGELPDESDGTGVEVIHIRVVVRFPTSQNRAGGGEPYDEVAIETYVFDVLKRNEAAGTPEEE